MVRFNMQAGFKKRLACTTERVILDLHNLLTLETYGRLELKSSSTHGLCDAYLSHMFFT